MKIAITGISGFIGSELYDHFSDLSFEVVGIPRNLTSDKESIEELSAHISDADVVINLRGAQIIKRHTEKYKQTLWESRINTTQNLVKAMELSPVKPSLLISASAVGIYSPGKKHDEYNFEYDSGFVGTLCREWENEALRAQNIGVRTIILRFGIVLGKRGGVVRKLLPIFRAGLGATILPAGSPFPWIHVRDLLEICHHFIGNEQCSGVYNLSANETTTQKDFAKSFAKALKKPLIFVIPGFFLKLLFGKGADIITRTPRVTSKRLSECHAGFRFNDINTAMTDVLRN